YDLLQRSRRHRADEHGVKIGQVSPVTGQPRSVCLYRGCNLAERERYYFVIASRRAGQIAGVPAIGGGEDSETHVTKVSRWLFFWRRRIADLGEVGELIV